MSTVGQARLTSSTVCVFCTTGVGAPPATHSVRALHPLRLPVLRQRLLHDGGTLCLQRRLPAHEGKGEVGLRQTSWEELTRFSCGVKSLS